VTYPTPYHPSYDTIASLVDDSDYIVIATVGSQGSTVGGYPLDVQNVLGFSAPHTLIGVTTAEFNAAHLTVGSTYVFFYGIDTVDNTDCIVGGIRGVFAYDPTTQTVMSLNQDVTSQITNTQTLAQLRNSINAEESLLSTEPISNGPPVCASTATGL
jgi:hypothetical protein